MLLWFGVATFDALRRHGLGIGGRLMTYETTLFFAVLFSVAGLPAYAVSRMPALRPQPAWKKTLVFIGATIGLLPPALFPALMIMFYVFGIDMLD